MSPEVGRGWLRALSSSRPVVGDSEGGFDSRATARGCGVREGDLVGGGEGGDDDGSGPEAAAGAEGGSGLGDEVVYERGDPGSHGGNHPRGLPQDGGLGLRVDGDQLGHQPTHPPVTVVDGAAAQQAVADDVEVAVLKGDEEGVLVGEVLVERADGETSPLGHVVGGARVAPLAEDVSSGVEDALDGSLGAVLNWASASGHGSGRRRVDEHEDSSDPKPMVTLVPGLATRYDALNTAIFPVGGSRRLRQRLVDVLAVRAQQRALELGCGTGQVTARLLAAGAEVVAVDALPEMLAGARRRAPGATFIKGDVLDVDVGGDYDRIVLSFVLHNLDAAGRVRLLRRAAAALAPDGRVGVLEWAVPPGRLRADAWRRLLTRLEPSPTVTDMLDGALHHDITAAGLHVDGHRFAAGGRAQILVLRAEQPTA
jgi:ubiquinone/menaquinone biosynthesis C-methylase UbiE